MSADETVEPELVDEHDEVPEVEPEPDVPVRQWALRPKPKYCGVPNCGRRPGRGGLCPQHEARQARRSRQ